MPTDKDFKRLVRARMKKTGEAYTTARAHLRRKTGPAVQRSRTTPRGAVATTPATAKADYAALAGMSDAAVRKATGCTWERWVVALDYAGAADWSHRAITDYVSRTWHVPGWWTQMVAVGYERIKGRRAIGQRLSGEFEANKSKTIAAPAAAITRAFTDARLRRKWIDGAQVTVRKVVSGKSVRMLWDDGTPVEVWLTGTKTGKTSVAIAHRKLASRDDVVQRKAYWHERLQALAALF